MIQHAETEQATNDDSGNSGSVCRPVSFASLYNALAVMSDQAVQDTGGDRLSSWKEIASCFDVSVRTVQRWEKEEGLPVHRHHHASQSSVFAFKRELEQWRARQSASMADPDPQPPAVCERSAALRDRRALHVLYGTVIVSLVILAYLSGLPGSLGGDMSPRQVKALAVMPFEDLSNNVDQEYFADGLTEALITELGNISALRVISRQSVIKYKNAVTSVPRVAEELNVDAVLQGTVLRAGDRVRITIQLLRAKPEEHVWANAYERLYAEVLALQADIASAVASQVKATLRAPERNANAQLYPQNPETLDAYLQGKYLYHGHTKERLYRAIGRFDTAIQKDPRFAPAWAALSPAYGSLGYWGYERPGTVNAKAKAIARKSVELDDTLADGHCSLAKAAAFADWDWSTAEREFKRSIELNPSDTDTRNNYALLLGSLRRAGEALAELRIARQLNPLHPVPVCLTAWCSYTAGQFESAAKQASQAVEMAPDFFLARSVYWRVLHRLGEDAAAYQQCKRMYELLGDAEVGEALRRGYSRAGYVGAMRRAADTLAMRSRTAYVPGTQVALLYAHAGENDRALEWLEKAHQERDGRIHSIWADPEWESLYSKPRFQELLRRMGFPSVERPTVWARSR